MNLNKAILIGRLTRDPELKTTSAGQSVTNFGLATSRFFTDKSGNKQSQTEFHNIVLFGRVADIASQYLTKGSLTYIEGRITTRSWEDAQGNKRYRTEVIGERLQLGPKSAGKEVPDQQEPKQENQVKEKDIPIIDEGEEEIDVKDIPF
jgi:single-strand DNA-binding protein